MSVSRRSFIRGVSLSAFVQVYGFAPAGISITRTMPNRLKLYREHSEKALCFLLERLKPDGSYGPEITDLAAYYKSTYLYFISGELEKCHLVLEYIKNNFLRNNGDFQTEAGLKSANKDYQNTWWAYPNTWVVLASQKIGRWDLAYPGYQYLKQYKQNGIAGYNTARIDTQTEIEVENIATSAMALLAMYFGELKEAEALGDTLVKFMVDQPSPQTGIYLRMDKHGKLITKFDADRASASFLDATKPEQYFFMAGYPMGVLALLYEATNNQKYLQGAQSYFDFARNCVGVHDYFFSHKVGWGASLLFRITKDRKYADLAFAICDHLVSIQSDNGQWLSSMEPVYSFDQTAECAIWLREISSSLMLAGH